MAWAKSIALRSKPGVLEPKNSYYTFSSFLSSKMEVDLPTATVGHRDEFWDVLLHKSFCDIPYLPNERALAKWGA